MKFTISALNIWQRIKFFFTKRYICVDFGEGDYTAYVEYKKVGGNLQIIKAEKYSHVPEIDEIQAISKSVNQRIADRNEQSFQYKTVGNCGNCGKYEYDGLMPHICDK